MQNWIHCSRKILWWNCIIHQFSHLCWVSGKWYNLLFSVLGNIFVQEDYCGSWKVFSIAEVGWVTYWSGNICIYLPFWDKTQWQSDRCDRGPQIRITCVRLRVSDYRHFWWESRIWQSAIIINHGHISTLWNGKKEIIQV